MAAHRDRYRLSPEERRAFEEIVRHLQDLDAPAAAGTPGEGTPAEEPPRGGSWWRRRRRGRPRGSEPPPSGEDG